MCKHIEVMEVCPRDGFQNLRDFIATGTKIEIIDRLVNCGFKSLEVTSFVSPKAIPQMADAQDIMTACKVAYGGAVELAALVPNLLGAQRAIERGADVITYVVSVSERHNLENTRQTVESSLRAFREVVKIKGESTIRLALATAFDCPFDGPVAPEAVMKVLVAGLDAGADDITFADTIGTASPRQVRELLEAVVAGFPDLRYVLHFHDTQGMALANVATAIELGAARFEAAAYGLGGCPFAPGAAGNVATEDLVNMLHKMGHETGIDLGKLIDTALYIGARLDLPATGHMAKYAVCKR